MPAKRSPRSTAAVFQPASLRQFARLLVNTLTMGSSGAAADELHDKNRENPVDGRDFPGLIGNLQAAT